MSKPSLSTTVFCLALLAATLAIYLPGLGNALVFDDNRLTDDKIFGIYGGLWPLRPRVVSYGSFVWIAELFGQGWWKQRLFNIALHLGVAAAVYAMLRELLQSLRLPDDSALSSDPLDRQAALRIAVAVFALNPVAVYAVAYLVQRSIVMAALFTALACWSFVRGLNTGRRGWFAGAAASYVLAVLSKETSVMAVVLAVPLYVFVKRPDPKRAGIAVGATLAVLAVAAAALYPFFGHYVGKTMDYDSVLYGLQLDAVVPGTSQRLYPLSLANEAALFFRYGALWLFPNVQWMSIDLRPAFPVGLASIQGFGALAFLVLLATSAWAVLRRSDAWGFAALCVLCPMLLYVTEFGSVWVQDPFVLYRSYLWAITLPGLVALALMAIPRRFVYQGGVILCLVLAALAYERQSSFRDRYAVWADAVEKLDAQAPVAAVGRWRPYLNRGAHFLDREMLEQAYADFSRAESLGDTQGASSFNLGMVLQLSKRHADALAAFGRAEAKGFKEGPLYLHRGESLFAVGRPQQAMENYATALRVAPNAPTAEHTRLRLAEAAAASGKYDVAIQEFKTLLAAKPQEERYQVGLGLAYVGKEDAAQAKAVFESMLAVRPSAVAHYGRGLAFVVAGDKAAGLRDLDQAIALDPRNELYKQLRTRVASQK